MSNLYAVLWSWFPLGRAGIRTGLLFICAFLIFILRVAQLHVGIRTSTSGIATLQDYALKYQTVQTAVWYLLSAWVYSQVFISSAPKSANIQWITDAKNNERPRLNERPIYLMAFFLILAIVQTAVHLIYDYDRVDLPTMKTNSEVKAAKPELGSIESVAPSTKIWASLPSIAGSAFKRALVMTVLTPFIYAISIRYAAWSYTLGFSKLIWNLPKSTALPSASPFHWHILWRTIWGGTLLILIWEVSNRVFSIYVAQEPLKNDRPITYESKDPNGSLLTGLKGKKLQTRVSSKLVLSSGCLLILTGIRVLGVGIDCRTFPGKTKGHIRRHRPKRRIDLVSDLICVHQDHHRNEYSSRDSRPNI